MRESATLGVGLGAGTAALGVAGFLAAGLSSSESLLSEDDESFFLAASLGVALGVTGFLATGFFSSSESLSEEEEESFFFGAA